MREYLGRFHGIQGRMNIAVTEGDRILAGERCRADAPELAAARQGAHRLSRFYGASAAGETGRRAGCPKLQTCGGQASGGLCQ